MKKSSIFFLVFGALAELSALIAFLAHLSVNYWGLFTMPWRANVIITALGGPFAAYMIWENETS